MKACRAHSYRPRSSQPTNLTQVQALVPQRRERQSAIADSDDDPPHAIVGERSTSSVARRPVQSPRNSHLYKKFEERNIPTINTSIGDGKDLSVTHSSQGRLRPVPDLDRRDLLFTRKELEAIFKSQAATVLSRHQRRGRTTNEWRKIPTDRNTGAKSSLAPGGLSFFRLLFILQPTVDHESPRRAIDPDLRQFSKGQIVALYRSANGPSKTWDARCCRWHYAHDVLQSLAQQIVDEFDLNPVLSIGIVALRTPSAVFLAVAKYKQQLLNGCQTDEGHEHKNARTALTNSVPITELLRAYVAGGRSFRFLHLPHVSNYIKGPTIIVSYELDGFTSHIDRLEDFIEISDSFLFVCVWETNSVEVKDPSVTISDDGSNSFVMLRSEDILTAILGIKNKLDTA